MRATQHHPSTSIDPGPPGRPSFAAERLPSRRGTVVRVSGELDAASAPALEAVFAEQAASRDDVLLDLSGTTFIDSAGIRVLVRSMWDLREAGATLRLVSASTLAENILRITGIHDVLKEPAP